MARSEAGEEHYQALHHDVHMVVAYRHDHRMAALM
jgi:hypothetical protein